MSKKQMAYINGENIDFINEHKWSFPVSTRLILFRRFLKSNDSTYDWYNTFSSEKIEQ